MSELENKVSKLERYSKALGNVRFTVSLSKDRATVKLWKKYNVCSAPDKVSAEILMETLNTTIKNQKDRIDEVLSLLSNRAEQLTLQLFSKEPCDALERDGDQSEGRVSDSPGEAPGGPQ